MVESAQKILNLSIKSSKAEEKLVKQQLRLEKEKRKKKPKTKLQKFLGARVVSKKVLRKSDTRAVVKEYQAPSVLGDPNRYFKDKYEEDKRRLFFS